MEARAVLRGYPTSTRKMRLMINLIRGKKIEEARNILLLSKRHSSRMALQTLNSAVSNFMQNGEAGGISEEHLFVKTAFVDQGVTLKRISPAPMGRAYRIRKRSNHVTIVVSSIVNKKK